MDRDNYHHRQIRRLRTDAWMSARAAIRQARHNKAEFLALRQRGLWPKDSYSMIVSDALYYRRIAHAYTCCLTRMPPPCNRMPASS